VSLLCCNTWNCPQFWQTSAVGLSVWSEVQTCIRPSWCHCHSLSLASVKSRLVLPFWYPFTRVVRTKECVVLNMSISIYVWHYTIVFEWLKGHFNQCELLRHRYLKVWKTRQITTGCNFNSWIRTDYDYRKFSDESDSKSFENQSTFGEVIDKSRLRPMCTIFWYTVLV